MPVPSPGNDADQGLFMGAQAIAGPAAQSLPVISVGSTDDTRITGLAVITFANNFTNITMGELQWNTYVLGIGMQPPQLRRCASRPEPLRPARCHLRHRSPWQLSRTSLCRATLLSLETYTHKQGGLTYQHLCMSAPQLRRHQRKFSQMGPAACAAVPEPAPPHHNQYGRWARRLRRRLQRHANFRDSIALIRRGTCTFAEKIQNHSGWCTGSDHLEPRSRPGVAHYRRRPRCCALPYHLRRRWRLARVSRQQHAARQL